MHDEPGGKPPWWPDDERWPPTGPEAWRGVRRRFLRRFALFLAAVVASVAVVAGLLGWFVFGGPGSGPDHRPGPPFFFPFWIVVVVVIVVLLLRAGRRFAAPLGDVMEAADRVAAGDYGTRVEERGPDEVRRLSRAFNEMTERLGSNEERRRRLLADVAHELRTPLSVIQANIEAVLDGLYPADHDHLGRVLEETRVMSRLLDDLQTLSTAEARALRLHRERVAPRDLVEAAVGVFSARASDAAVTLRAEVADVPEIDVDPVRIGEVLSNLLSNAVRHTPAGGEVVVTASSTPDGVEFGVRDTGPGIPPDQLPHAFDRFSKSPDSPGAGLGLAIARSLVEAHGGAIRAESSSHGTTISFTVPSAEPT
jgi:two-component system OmpR family sensor kinase/two-component system sensor histidine kinase BaeS